MKYFCFDTELGGLKKEYSLLTLYGQILNEDLNILDEIDLKIKPDDGIYKVSAEALKINGINLVEHDKNSIPLSEASEKFKNFICRHSMNLNQKIIPMGHNISLDIKFAKNYLMNSTEWEKHFSYRKVDSHSVAMFLGISGFLPKYNSYSLKVLAEHFKLDTNGMHDARKDVEITTKLLKLMSNTLKETK
jgi:DNA polymerase III alpha subunit (gram-positive type)